MDNLNSNEHELQRFTIKYSSSKLTVEQVGVVVTQTAVMYRIIQDYLGSPHNLQLVKVVRGSYIFEYLGDPVVLDHVYKVTMFIWSQAQDLWEYIGDAITWDFIKMVPFGLRKISDLSQKEAEEFSNAVTMQQRISLESNSIVEYDFGNNKIIEYRGDFAKDYIDLKKQQSEFAKYANYYNARHGEVLPPRSTKHKYRK